MKDNYGRNIDYMRVSVTEKCNLNCFYCMPEKDKSAKKEKELSKDQIIKIVKNAAKAGIKKVRITGGEPLVRKDIYEIISGIKSIEEIEEVTLTTNGINLLGNVKKIKQAGVNRVNVSLDTLHPKTYQNITKSHIKFDFDSLIDEINKENLKPFKLNVVLLRGINSDHIDEFISLADKYDIFVRFIELMDIGETGFDYNKYYISKDEVLKMHPELSFIKNKGNTSIYEVNGNKGNIGFINPVSNKFCDSCNRLRLTADGNIKPCLHSSKEIPIELDDELYIEELIRNAIEMKPKEHELDNEFGDRTKRSMNKIGG